MDGMATSVLDRVVRWNLDFDGDIYGDERERLRWYEGIATAASLQWIAIPWACALLVLGYGRPVVAPLVVILVVLVVPMAMCTAYVRHRRVDAAVRRWTGKRIVLSTAFTVPLLLFLFASLWAYGKAGSSVWWGAAGGALFGAGLSAVTPFVRSRRLRRETPAAEDED
jgi:hypothetical protein